MHLRSDNRNTVHIEKLSQSFYGIVRCHFFVLILFSVYLCNRYCLILKKRFTDGASVAPIAAETTTNLVATSKSLWLIKTRHSHQSQEAALEVLSINPPLCQATFTSGRKLALRQRLECECGD